MKRGKQRQQYADPGIGLLLPVKPIYFINPSNVDQHGSSPIAVYRGANRREWHTRNRWNGRKIVRSGS